MRNKTFIALFTAILAVMFVVTGCSLGPNDPGVETSGVGRLALSIKGVTPRTIMPAVTYKAEITSKDEDGEDDETIVKVLTAGMNTFSLPAGSYDITVTAYNGTTAIADGSKDGVVIDPTRITQVDITLSPIDSTAAKGTFSWDLDAFADAAKVGITINEIIPIDYYDLGEFNDDIKTWNTNGADDIETGLTTDMLKAAKYLVLAFDSEKRGGFGGTQLAANGDIDSWSWHQWDVSSGWDQPSFLDWNSNIRWYLVVDLDSLPTFKDVFESEKAKFILNGKDGTMTFVAGYLTEADLSSVIATGEEFKGGDGSCYAIPEFPDYLLGTTQAIEIDVGAHGLVDSIELDAGTYLVGVDVDGVQWNEILWIIPGMVSDYQPAFENIFVTDGDELEDLVLGSIAAGDYDELLWSDFGLLGVSGVNADNINDIQTAIGVILGDETAVVPTTTDELKVLIDAALIVSLASSVDTTVINAAEVDLKGFAANGTDVTFDWTGYVDPAYELAIAIGGVYEVIVSIPPPVEPEFIDKLSLNEQNAVYRFVLPAGATFGDYKAIKVTYKMYASTVTLRAVRLMGNYQASNFKSAPDGRYMAYCFNANTANGGSANAPYIFDDLGTSSVPATDDWFTLTYRLVGNVPNSGFVAANRPANDATGPFLFGIGIPGWGVRIQEVKNITMVHKTDPKKNVLTDDFFGIAGYIYTNGEETTTDERYTASSVERNENPDYAGVASTFDLDLSGKFSGTLATNPFMEEAAGTVEGGALTLKFNNVNGSVGLVPLTTAQTALVMAPTTRYLLITVDGSADPDSEFRWGLANPAAGGSWNGTNLIGQAKFSTFTGTKLVTFTGNRADATVGTFLLQLREATATDVTINSITIRCMK